ncbi:MAG TPA: tetratricopeptide repeat protein [Acidimicrobiales bacterium]|nr:tetratricopeptide repeat protein [Acidimicrobiales bacterium]
MSPAGSAAEELATAHRAAAATLQTGTPEEVALLVARVEGLLETVGSPDDFDVVNVGLLRARACALTGDTDQAMAIAADTVERAHKLEPGADASRLLVQALLDAGDFRRAAGRLNEAGPPLTEALTLACTELGPADPDTGSAWNSIGMWHRYRGELDEARHAYGQAAQVFGVVGGDDHAGVLHNLASLEHLAGNLEMAEALIRQALALRDPDGPQRAGDLGVLAVVLAESGQYAEAAVAYEEARARILNDHGEESAEFAYLLANEAVLHHRRGDLVRAEAGYAQALRLTETLLGPEHPQTAAVLANSAQLAADRGDQPRAAEQARRAVRILAGRVAPDLPSLRSAHAVLEAVER